MEIDLSNIKKSILKLKKLEELYQNLYYEYYNVIERIDEEWKNKFEKRLMLNIEDEKKEMMKIINDINEICLIYSIIYEKYKIIGKRIKINLENKDIIIRQINNCINRLRIITSICNSIDINNLNEYQIVSVNNTLRKANNTINNLNEIKNSIFSTCNMIEEIEEDIKTRINELKITIIKETDIANCIEQ